MLQEHQDKITNTNQGFSTFRNDTNLFSISEHQKYEQSTFNDGEGQVNQSLHYSNLVLENSKEERTTTGIFCPTHNENGIYKCSICSGLRQVCPGNQVNIKKNIEKELIGNENFNSQNATFGKVFGENKFKFHHGRETKNLSESLEAESLNLKGNPFEKPMIWSSISNQQRVQIIEEIHYVPVFHTVITPEVINPECQSNSKKEHQSTEGNIQRNFGPLTPSRVKSYNDEEIMTPESLRKLAESILR